jgi:tryptophan-rich sensory protein
MVLVYLEQFKKKFTEMRSLLYLIAVILIIGWILGFFVYPVGGGLIHILLVIAVIAIILGVIRRA